MKEEPKIMYASDEAATYKSVEGWVSHTGRFWGKDEHIARWEGCTHLVCECGNEMTKHYTKCDTCIAKIRKESYEALPFQEWDGKHPLALYNHDTYFFDEDSIIDYLEDNELNPEELNLVLCDPCYLREIDGDYFADELPEDRDLDDCCPELRKMIDEFNLKIKSLNEKNAISWYPGKIRTVYKPQPVNG